jgi:hypothetical protein
MLARNGADLDISDDTSAERFCEAVMNQAPPKAIVQTRADRQTFSLWYCQKVEGMRPDVAIVDEGLTSFEWYRARLLREHPDLWRGPSDAQLPLSFTDERPRCRIHREAQTVWLECQV